MNPYRLTELPPMPVVSSMGGEGLNPLLTRKAVINMLTDQSFVEETLRSADLGYRPRELSYKLMQAGRLNAVWKVSMDETPLFGLVVSRGEEFNEHTKADFNGLNEVVMATDSAEISRLCPMPYLITNTEYSPNVKLDAFSVEWVNGMHEMISFLKIYGVSGNEKNLSHHTFMSFLFNDTESDILNRSLVGAPVIFNHPNEAETAMYQSPSYEATNHMVCLLAKKLRIINLLTGKVPARFSIDAGDFNLGSERAMIMTMKEGLMGLKADDFNDWFYSLKGETNCGYLAEAGFFHYIPAMKLFPKSLPITYGHKGIESAIAEVDYHLKSHRNLHGL